MVSPKRRNGDTAGTCLLKPRSNNKTIWGGNNYIRINSITGSIVRERIDEDSCQWKPRWVMNGRGGVLTLFLVPAKIEFLCLGE